MTPLEMKAKCAVSLTTREIDEHILRAEAWKAEVLKKGDVQSKDYQFLLRLELDRALSAHYGSSPLVTIYDPVLGLKEHAESRGFGAVQEPIAPGALETLTVSWDSA